MKSSSLGARLFEGLVQPILGSLWNSPSPTIETSGDRNNISSAKHTPVQRPGSRDQPASSCFGAAPAVRSSVYQQRHGSCGNGGTRVAVTGGTSSRKPVQSVSTRSLNNGVRLANAVTSSDTRAAYSGMPPAAERSSQKRQKRALQRQAAYRSKEECQRTIKGVNNSHAAASITTRCVTRHTAPGASVPVTKSQRAKQQTEQRRGETPLKRTAPGLCGKPQCPGGELYGQSVATEGSQGSTKNVAIAPATGRTVDAVGSPERDALPLAADGAAEPCSGHGHTCGNNSGRGNCGLGTGLPTCKTCNSGSDCSSSSSSSWAGEECDLPSGKSSLSFGENMDHIDIQPSGQAWSTVRTQQLEGQHPLKKLLLRHSKHQHGQAQRDLAAFKYAVSLEQGPPEIQLHSSQSTVPSASCVVSLANSCSAGPSSCRLQCSDTTTTCSGSSMTTCGDSRDTATGSAAMALEHQQPYLDIEEQMPPAFPTCPAEDPPPTLCAKRAGFPSGQTSASVSYSSSLEPTSIASSCPYVHAAVETSSNPSGPLAVASSVSAAAESIRCGNGGCGLASSHSTVFPHSQEAQAALGSALDDASNNIRAQYASIPTSARDEQQQRLQPENSAAGVAAAPRDMLVPPDITAEHEDDCCQGQTGTNEACAADNEMHHEQQDQQQQRQPDGLASGSVVFGHRVLKPLRSKCLEENYDALVEIVAFTKRRCERETMELLRKDVHILYYARGLHHAAHVETYLRQQQSQQGKQSQPGRATLPGNNSIATASTTTNLNMPSSSAHPVPQSTSAAALPADAPATEKRNPAASCFPSVSAALAGGARPQAVPDWATPEALRDALERQQCYDPFSIFGEAPPELLLSEVYDEQHYTHISPQTRASHPVLARLKHQRSAALMAVFQQKRAALARTQQLLEHELRQLQQEQQRSTSSQQQKLLDHGGLSSVLGRAVLSFSSRGIAAVKGGAATMKTDVKDGGGYLSLLQLKTMQNGETPESRSDKDKEAMLRIQQREVLVQQQLLERRLEEQLQQEERIHGELLRNGFRFLGGRINGGESGAALFRKWVLPALESWWQQQCQVELDWRNDPLTSEECSWYREVMNASVDASDLISIQQACFCPTPPPYRQWTWTDCRVRQRQQHEQNLARQRQQQETQQQQEIAHGKDDSPTAVDWIARANTGQNNVEEIAEVGECVARDEKMSGAEADCDELPPVQEDTAAEQRRTHGKLAGTVVGKQNCAHDSVVGESISRKQHERLVSGRTPSRKSRKRRAKEGDRTPQGYGNNVEAPGSDRETAAGASNSGSARKRPRSFSRHVKNLRLQPGQADGSQNVQAVAECSSGHCACGSRLVGKSNFTKEHFCLTSATKNDTLFLASASAAALKADKNCHSTGNVRSTGGNADVTPWQQSLAQLNEETNLEDTHSNAAATAGTCKNVFGRGNGESILSSPCHGRQAGHAFSTPVAKMQALKLSKQQLFASNVPVQQAQLREKAVDRGKQQQHPYSAPFAPLSTKTAVSRQVASPGDQSFVSPIPSAATTKTQACHLLGSWRGSGGPVAATRSAWDSKAATTDTSEGSITADGATSCFTGPVGDGHCIVASTGVSDASFSTAAGEARCRATRTLKQLKMSAAQRRPKQLQKQGIRSAGAAHAQESCLPTCKPGAGVQVASGTGTQSRLAAATVREISSGKFALAVPASSAFMGKGTCSRDSSTIRSLYLPGGGNVRATTLQTVRGARLSIDRVYGCRRTSDFLHGRTRSQFVLESLARPATTFATGKGDKCGLPVDDICKKDIECINNGAI